MSSKIFCFLTGLLLLIVFSRTEGQKILSPEVMPADARFDNFILNNGDSESATISLLQDRKGFIWCGTELALYRFDGIKYKRFGLGLSDSTLQGYTVFTIFEDSESTLWAGTAGALNRINPGSGIVSHFLPDTSDFASHDNTIRYINEDKTGMLWLVTERDIFTFERKSESFTRYPLNSTARNSEVDLLNVDAERFIEDKSGRIWIGTDDGLFVHSPKNNSWVRIFPGKLKQNSGKTFKINSIKEDSTGTIWIGTDTGGLLRIEDPEKGHLRKIDILQNSKKLLSADRITAMSSESPDRLWTFGNSTLTRYNPVTGESLSYFFSDPPLQVVKWGNDLRINKIFIDKEGKLWLIDLGSGSVFKFNPATENLSYYKVPRFVEFDCIRDNTGNFWFASVAQNMFRMLTDTLPFMTTVIPNSDFVEIADKSRMCQDMNGDLWLALSGGVFKIRDPAVSSSLKLGKLDLPENNGEPGCVLNDRSGNLWFGLSKGIVYKYNPAGKSFKKFILPPGTFINEKGFITIISEDKSGSIWFATQTEGLFRLTPHGNKIENVIKWRDLPGSRGETILFDFLIDSKDNIWISTFYGLYRTDIECRNIKNYTGFDNTGRTYGNFYSRIVEDNKRQLWVLNSLAGPYIFESKGDTFVRQQISGITSEFGYSDLLFDKSDRLWLSSYGRIKTVDQLTGISRDLKLPEKTGEIHSLLLESGIRVFLLNNKLYVFPEKVPYNNFIPPVYITGLYINEKDIYRHYPELEPPENLKKVDLNYRQNNLRLEFAALNYTNPDQNKYRYFMEGVDIDTMLTDPGSPAVYKKMAPGRYKFWVTGSNNDGFWNPSGTTLEILIHPPWYLSVLAFILYFIAAGSLIAIYIKYRTYSLQKDKIRLESEVKARTGELETANRQLSEVDRIKTHFFTDISHEIRTPLSLIIGPLEIISKEEPLNERVSGMVDIMRRNAQRLMQLVNQLLDISRLDAGKMKITLVKDDLVKCLRILVYEFVSAAEAKQIKYIAELPENEFITWFDRDKIEKIISNLLSNAFKYTGAGGTIQCRIKIERVNKDPVQHILRIIINDTGLGIEKENLEKIFDRFFRIEGRSESDGHGTGIGLSLTQEFTSLMHGEIKVNSNPGKGSEFIVIIPLGKDHLTADEYVSIQSELEIRPKQSIINFPFQQSNDKKGKTSEGPSKILVIEDNEDLRNFIKDNLAGGYQMLGAENGKTGINLAFTMMPDIIITDIMMPDIDGIQLCTQLKNDERTSHIPIILLTARATMENKLEGLRSGADDYIIKPFLMDELKARIANLLAVREKLKLKYSGPAAMAASVDRPQSVDDMFIAKVVRVIGENISNFDFDVEMLHERLGMSRMHLSRKLKILTGESPHMFIKNTRLKKATELLLKQTGNITQIAYSVGFSNSSAFTKAFRDYFGVSPKKYLKQ